MSFLCLWQLITLISAEKFLFSIHTRLTAKAFVGSFSLLSRIAVFLKEKLIDQFENQNPSEEISPYCLLIPITRYIYNVLFESIIRRFG